MVSAARWCTYRILKAEIESLRNLTSKQRDFYVIFISERRNQNQKDARNQKVEEIEGIDADILDVFSFVFYVCLFTMLFAPLSTENKKLNQ